MVETRLLLRPMESSFDTQAMTYPTRSMSVGMMCFIHLRLSLFITTIAVNRRLYIGMPILPSNAPLQQVTEPKSHTVYVASQKILNKDAIINSIAQILCELKDLLPQVRMIAT